MISSPALVISPTLAAVHHHSVSFSVNWSIQPLLALVAGVLILIRPKWLNVIVAVYLIVIGLMGVFRWG